MKNKIPALTVLFLTLFLFVQCGVKEVVDETTLSLRCVNLIQELDEKNDNNPDRSCDDVVADINEIERICGDFITDANRAQFDELRALCEAN